MKAQRILWSSLNPEEAHVDLVSGLGFRVQGLGFWNTFLNKLRKKGYRLSSAEDRYRELQPDSGIHEALGQR